MANFDKSNQAPAQAASKPTPPLEGTEHRPVVIYRMHSLFRRLWGQTVPDSYPLLSATGRLSLSPISEEDHATVARWFQDVDSCRLAFGVDADDQTLFDMTADYLKELRDDATGVLMIKTREGQTPSQPVGFLRYKLFRQSRRSLARVGILLGHCENRGQGLGSEAMQTLVSYLFERRSVDVVELDTAHFNGAAQGCFLKCGFQSVRETEVIGLHNRWTERRIIMRLTSEQWRASLSQTAQS
jgi:RimJ/RimL family protein N-acetyltransferase